MKKDFYKKYALPILGVVVFLLAFIWMGTRATIESNSNSVESWLPDNYLETKDYRWYLEHFPFESFVVISWDGCSIDDENRIEFFAQKLVPDQTLKNFSLMAPSNEISATMDLTNIASRIDKNKVHNQRKQEQSDLSANTSTTDSESEKNNPFTTVMTGPRLLHLLEQSYSRLPGNNGTPEELRAMLVKKLTGTLIGPDGKSTALIVTLSKEKRNGKELKIVLDYIRKLAVECGLPDTTKVQTGNGFQRIGNALKEFYMETRYGRIPNLNGLIMGGPPTDNVALDQEGERTLYRLAGICALVGLTLAIICLKSVRLTMFVFWVAIISSGIALAMVSATGGTCDSILLSMPALVYIIAMSGSIHLVNYYHDAIKEGGLAGATERSVQHAFKPTFFAQFTTAIGLGSLYASHLTPIVKFGFYSAIGVLSTLVLMFLYLPALLYFYPSKKYAEKYGGKGDKAPDSIITKVFAVIGKYNIKYNVITVIALASIMIFLGAQLKNMKTSVKMMNFFSPDADIIAHYSWLEDKLGPLVPMELVISFDNSSLPQNIFGTTERLRLINRISKNLKSKLSSDIGGTLSVGLFTPDIDEMLDSSGSGTIDRKNVRYTTIGSVVGKTINNNRDNLKDYLAIEGNPSLTELENWFRSKSESDAKQLVSDRSALEKKLNAQGFELSDTITEIEELDSGTRISPKNKKKSNPFITDVRSYLNNVQEAQKSAKIVSILAENKQIFSTSEIFGLKDLFLHLPKERPFRSLTLEETQLLLFGAEKWQQEKGIDLWRISIRVWSLKKDIDYSQFINDVKSVVEPTIKEVADQIAKTITDAGGTVPQMEEPVVFKKKNSFFVTDEVENKQNCLMGDSHSSDIVYPVGISAKYTGMVPLVYKTQHELIGGLTQSLMWSFVLIAFVIMFIYRDWAAVIVAMPSNIFPVVIVFGYMSWRGILIDVGTMMTASVALGVAVDDTIHYLTWFNDAIDNGADIPEATQKAYQRCATAMLESSIISGLGLFAFAFSTFVPTQRFGVMMLAILWAAVFGDLIMLPAILAGPLGRFYVKRRRRGNFRRPKQIETTEPVAVCESNS